MKFKVKTGFPEQMGAKNYGEYVNFTVAVRDGESCSLIFYKKGSSDIVAEFPFTSEMQYGNLYAMAVYGVDIELYDYNYRINNQVVTDPYARKINGTALWGMTDDSKVATVITRDEYDWEGDRPIGIPFEDSIIYRLHVRGFTKHSSSKVKKRGTFHGLMEKIPYLKELGITMIELMPAYEFREVVRHSSGPAILEDQPVNYWGYTNANYFAPKASYAAAGKKGGQIQEFKEMVKEFHKNGIEVGMEFYFPEGTNRNMILECFHFWVKEYHIDGIHCNIDEDMKTLLKEDPVLGRTKLICYSWNAEGEYSYFEKSLNFKNLGECNDAFMITARKFLKSDEGQIGDMSFRIKKNQNTVQMVNYLANNGTFSLYDMVSYERKHNEANGENNHDGTEYNYSWNCGFEGKTRRKKVLNLRRKQIKNAWIFLMLSQGTPMIYAGDEFLNTTQGNNNPYCQDNDISWLNWNLEKKNQEYIDYVKYLITFRRQHKILHMRDELRIMDYKSLGLPDMSYHGSKAWYLDYSHLNRHFSVMYCGKYSEMEEPEQNQNIYIAYNMYWEQEKFGLPTPAKDSAWKKILATGEEELGEQAQKEVIGEKEISVPPRSVVVLVSEEIPANSNKKKRRKQ